MACGKMVGHGVSCVKGYECDQCEEITKLKKEIKRLKKQKQFVPTRSYLR